MRLRDTLPTADRHGGRVTSLGMAPARVRSYGPALLRTSILIFDGLHGGSCGTDGYFSVPGSNSCEVMTRMSNDKDRYQERMSHVSHELPGIEYALCWDSTYCCPFESDLAPALFMIFAILCLRTWDCADRPRPGCLLQSV